MIVEGCESTVVEVGTGKQRTKIGIWEVNLGRESESILGEVISKVCFEVRGWNY